MGASLKSFPLRFPWAMSGFPRRDCGVRCYGMRNDDEVEELTGPYGPFTLAERAVQRIWAGGEVRGPLPALSGAIIDVVRPGEWNRGAGPDFLGAELRVDGARVRGDVEIHLRCGDWQAHGHDADAAYDAVVLHAVLLPELRAVTTRSGRTPEAALLLPHLPRDLEELAEEDALLELRGRATDIVRGLRDAGGDLAGRLRTGALERFRRKAAHAAARLAERGWEGACHALFVESLGSGGNRAPFSELAADLPPEAMTLLGLDAVYMRKCGRWRLRGLRPTGHPYRRLGQYLELNRTQPAWRESLLRWAERPHEGIEMARRELHEQVLARALPEGRADTVAIDALLPLLQAHGRDMERAWMDWPPGNRPDEVEEARRLLGFPTRARNWEVQGLLGLTRAGRPTPSSS